MSLAISKANQTDKTQSPPAALEPKKPQVNEKIEKVFRAFCDTKDLPKMFNYYPRVDNAVIRSIV